MELEYLLINGNKEEEGTNYRYLNLSNAIKVKTKTTIEQGLVAGIIILLDMVSIAL